MQAKNDIKILFEPRFRRWFAGDQISLADFQMSFAVEAAMSRADNAASYPHLKAYRDRMVGLPAYRKAVEKGGPVVMGN